jgi:hypothetical protein
VFGFGTIEGWRLSVVDEVKVNDDGKVLQGVTSVLFHIESGLSVVCANFVNLRLSVPTSYLGTLGSIAQEHFFTRSFFSPRAHGLSQRSTICRGGCGS